MHDFLAMRIFVAVADAQSFASAARRLGLSTSAVSHHVAKLERTLGIALLNRSTRQMALTEDGAQYLCRARPIVEEADALFRETRECGSGASGRLKVTVPPGVAEHMVMPSALDFIRRHPRLELVLDFDARQTDVIADGYDAAIRAGALVGPGLKSRRLGEIRFRLCATPTYLKQYGTPSRIADLARHHVITSHIGIGPPARHRGGSRQPMGRSRLRSQVRSPSTAFTGNSWR